MALSELDYRFIGRKVSTPPHQQRVVDEKTELDEKHSKLRAFLGREDFTAVVSDEKERERLYRQSSIMAEYSLVLAQRIEAFK